ncbi:probable G-protein coupled receptor 139 [Callorhinchus milii]|uniref:probable G-protein coupled receptor 139 n=1 Tax=Callorhinchus milii TaxID=7868 RepID=UPI001C3FDE2D|nr:probable G-protein coupled receptor 139 [Callorhinchus milii]
MKKPLILLVIITYFPILVAVGIPANIMAIVILLRGKCGLSKCVALYLVMMSASDLMVLVFAVLFGRIIFIFHPESFLHITPLCSLNKVLLYLAKDTSVWFTVAFSFDRFIAICCHKLKTKYCTWRTARVVTLIIYVLFSIKNIPIFFAFKPQIKIKNVPWFCQFKEIVFTAPEWIAFDWIDYILTPLIPFFLILLLNSMTVRYISVASRVRRRIRITKPQSQNDPEIKNRRKSIILLFTISGIFILLWMTRVIDFFYYYITSNFSDRDFNDAAFALKYSGDMLQLLSSCTNMFIYVVTQAKFREELRNLAKYPFICILKLVQSKK